MQGDEDDQRDRDLDDAAAREGHVAGQHHRRDRGRGDARTSGRAAELASQSISGMPIATIAARPFQ